ncbi:succinate dehydrogenase subunit C [Kineothrix alysoides]|uniref:Succinate dehydrogenase subunit C n=1 Tax=Kineothrix alysoides TaxID=1469948 RepID=A0A4R1QVQ6_9FIRM|nr:hypothetical protein [Kineothrix alysoides]TCL58049.1 succinate dehydrogenase subunit C [Kineothrix alysoides]
MDNNNLYPNDGTQQGGVFTGTGPEPYGNSNQNQGYAYGQQGGYEEQGQGYGQQNSYGNSGQNQGYGYGQQGGQGYQYPSQGGYQQELEEPMSVGEWLVSLLLAMFVPCVGIVLVFVWAFSKTEKKSKSNFFKAYLIIAGVVLAVYILIMVVVMIALSVQGI